MSSGTMPTGESVEVPNITFKTHNSLFYVDYFDCTPLTTNKPSVSIYNPSFTTIINKNLPSILLRLGSI